MVAKINVTEWTKKKFMVLLDFYRFIKFYALMYFPCFVSKTLADTMKY